MDKFHVVRMANEAMEKVRKSLRTSLQPNQRRTLMHDRFILLKRNRDLDLQQGLLLSTWLGNHKDLETAYRLKEAFYDIWDASMGRDDAIRRYRSWATEAAQLGEFRPIIVALTNWEKEIFAHFDHKITNAYTESLNGLIKVMNRLGRGYSFEALRAKILFTGFVHKIKRPSFGRSSSPGLMGYSTGSSYTMGRIKMVNCGTNISILSRLLESEEF